MNQNYNPRVDIPVVVVVDVVPDVDGESFGQLNGDTHSGGWEGVINVGAQGYVVLLYGAYCQGSSLSWQRSCLTLSVLFEH